MAGKNNRKLCDLRVVDLRFELEKRDLDKSGVKQTLTERLLKAMKEEGLDPETYIFGSDGNKSKLENAEKQQPKTDIKTDMNHIHEEIEIHENNSVKKVSVNGTQMKSETVIDAVSEDITTVLKKDEAIDIINTNEVLTTTNTNTTTRDDIIIHDIVTVKQNIMDVTNTNTVLPETPTVVLEQKDEKITANACGEVEPADTLVIPISENTEEEQKIEEAEQKEATVNRSNVKFEPINFAIGENRTLWIANLPKNTKATCLKEVLLVYGKVIAAKVVANSKYPGAGCFGYVTMDTEEEADICIDKLNNTEMNGHIISVDKVRSDNIFMKNVANQVRQSERLERERMNQKEVANNGLDKIKVADNELNKKIVSNNEIDTNKVANNEDTNKVTINDVSAPKTKSVKKPIEFPKKSKSPDDRTNREFKHKAHDNSLLTFNKIKEERDRQRLHEKERQVREENRRRIRESQRQRDVDRMQRVEAIRLERERMKLRIERERLEKDRANVMKLEKERQKFEREKLELEKLELEKVRLRLEEEDRRAAKRTSYRRDDSYFETKRSRHYENEPEYPSRHSKPTYSEREYPSYYKRDEREHKPGSDSKSAYAQYNKDPDHFDLSNNSTINRKSAAPPSRVFKYPSKSWKSTRWPSNSTSRSDTGFSNPTTNSY